MANDTIEKSVPMVVVALIASAAMHSPLKAHFAAYGKIQLTQTAYFLLQCSAC
jgi:hypothetical protein